MASIYEIKKWQKSRDTAPLRDHEIMHTTKHKPNQIGFGLEPAIATSINHDMSELKLKTVQSYV